MKEIIPSSMACQARRSVLLLHVICCYAQGGGGRRGGCFARAAANTRREASSRSPCLPQPGARLMWLCGLLSVRGAGEAVVGASSGRRAGGRGSGGDGPASHSLAGAPPCVPAHLSSLSRAEGGERRSPLSLASSLRRCISLTSHWHSALANSHLPRSSTSRGLLKRLVSCVDNSATFFRASRPRLLQHEGRQGLPLQPC
jgi:hypothetical protein